MLGLCLDVLVKGRPLGKGEPENRADTYFLYLHWHVPDRSWQYSCPTSVLQLPRQYTCA